MMIMIRVVLVMMVIRVMDGVVIMLRAVAMTIRAVMVR